MPAPVGGGGGGGQDNSLGPLWMTVGIFVAGGLIWYLAHDYLVLAFFKFKLAEMFVIRPFTSGLDGLHSWMQSIPLRAVSTNDLGMIATKVGEYLRYPAGAVLVVLAVLLYLRGGVSRFEKKYSMRSLRNQEKKIWPQIEPVSKLDLVNEPLDKGPWAMSLNPRMFVDKYDLVQVVTVEAPEGHLSKSAREKAVLKKGVARRVFIMQLGELWQGAEALPIHIQALFVVFVARCCGHTDQAKNLLDQIAASANSGKLDFTGVEALARQYKDKPIVKAVEKHHAYMLTLMPVLLENARLEGVLATADFLWLKPVDRPLWYTLNNVGRQTTFVEVAGPRAHCAAEKELGKRLRVPLIEQAVAALDVALLDVLYKKDE